MNIPFEADPVTFESLRPPVVLVKRDAFNYMLCDNVSVFIATYTSLIAAGHHNDVSALPFAGATTLWTLLIFEFLGLYRRSYSVFPRDECYYSFVALAIASVPMLTLAAFVPQLRSLFPVIASAVGIGFTLMAGGRAILFGQLSPAGTRASASVTTQTTVSSFLKRVIDVALATIALALFMPLMVIAAAAIYIESGRPIFFRQERMGLRGRIFHILKFRTMQTDAGNEWARPGDKRITRLGSALRRFSIDELPQIFNVLQGDMSVVGPRPEMRSFAAHFREYLPSYDQRHEVRPGLTGWAQVYMKRNLTPADAHAVLLHDLFYIRHCSIYLDLVLICKTAAEFLFHRAV